MNYLLGAALLPVVVLCYFIYKRDNYKEPVNLLAKLFIFGCLIVIPIFFFELFLGSLFSTRQVYDFFMLFINVFISIGLVEEGFKWIVVKIFGYNNQEFDEIYDIIVYSVFVSLGFACVENIIYVFSNGFSTAIMRALTAVPGHTCFAVIMGYFLSKAKVNEINNSNGLFLRNLLFSLFIPTAIHSFYDAVLMYSATVDSLLFLGIFYLFILITYVICFIIIDHISTVQNTITRNVKNGNITYNQGNIAMNTAQINQGVTQQTSTVNMVPNFCPICGKSVRGANFCGFCGYKLKQ